MHDGCWGGGGEQEIKLCCGVVKGWKVQSDHGDTQHRGWLAVTLASSNQRTVREGSGEECIPHSQEVRMAAGLYARQR